MHNSDKRIALLSVYNKEGIVEFAKALIGQHFDIISSGGTAKKLVEAGVPVIDVAELTGMPAVLGHRVVTLQPMIHGGLMAQYDVSLEEMAKLGWPYIDLVRVDLYPLKEEIAKKDSTKHSVIEKVDIGGPTMIRSGAKGERIVICEAKDQDKVLDWLKAGEPEREEFIDALHAKAEAYVADYVLASARYFGKGKYDGMIGEKTMDLKYGENAIQSEAALFTTHSDDPLSLDKFELVAGSAPSYNNICDLDRQLQTMTHLVAGATSLLGKSTPIKVVVAGKHGNPCGAAIDLDPIVALQKAIAGDTRAIFGGLVTLNFEVDEVIANELLTHLMPEGARRLLDGIIAPSFTNEAIEMLRRKGDKCRFLANPALSNCDEKSLDQAKRFRYVRGGFLTQTNYTFIPMLDTKTAEDKKFAVNNPYLNMMMAWAIGATSNSNTVCLVRDLQLIGNGVGQQDRVGGAKLAVMRAEGAGHKTENAIAYSDSFFPFTDGVEVLADAGIKTILATSGSVRDAEVMEFAESKGISMHLIPDAEGRGFYNH